MATDSVPLQVHADIAYVSPHEGGDPLHTFDLYVPDAPPTRNDAPPISDDAPLTSDDAPPTRNDPNPRPLICFVHGGAWRSEDKADHAPLARRLAQHTRLPVAVPNYRLTTPATPLRHPAHAHDLLRFLQFVCADGDGGRDGKGYSALYLLGHSCSAHMLTSIFLAPSDREVAAAHAQLAPSPALVRATRAIALSEGLYDLDLILKSYPSYKDWFIRQAFGDRPSGGYAPWNVASYALRPGVQRVRWLVLHSDGDTLVDRPQSACMDAHLRALYAGEADERVQSDWDSLAEEHNEMLAGEVYPRIVADFVLKDLRRAEGG